MRWARVPSTPATDSDAPEHRPVAAVRHGLQQFREIESRQAVRIAQPRAVGQREALRGDALRDEERALDLDPGGGAAGGAERRPKPLGEHLGEEVVARLVHEGDDRGEGRRALDVGKPGGRRGRADPGAAAHGNAAVPEQSRQAGGHVQRRVGRAPPVGLDAFVQAERRQGSTVDAHAGLPGPDGASGVEVAGVADDGALDPLHALASQRRDEVGEPRGLQVQDTPLVGDRRQARVAVALEVDRAAIDAVGIDHAGGIEGGREAVVGSPPRQRGRAGDELLV